MMRHQVITDYLQMRDLNKLIVKYDYYFEGHISSVIQTDANIYHIQLFDDLLLIATENTIQILDSATLKVLSIIPINEFCMSFSLLGDRLIVGTQSKELQYWNWKTQKLLFKKQVLYYIDYILSLKNGNILTAGQNDNIIDIFGDQVLHIENDEFIIKIAIADKYILVAYENYLKLYTQDGQLISTLKISLSWLFNTTKILGVSTEGIIYNICLFPLTCQKLFSANIKPYAVILLSSEKIALSQQFKTQIWDIKNQKLEQVLAGARNIALLPDDTIISGSSHGELYTENIVLRPTVKGNPILSIIVHNRKVLCAVNGSSQLFVYM